MRPSSRSIWIGLGLGGLLAGLLSLSNRDIDQRAALLEARMVAERQHLDKLSAIRRRTRESFVAVLERWLKAPAERPSLRQPLEALVEDVRQSGAEFAGLPALGPDEEAPRDQLINDLAAWSSSLSVSIDSDEGPEGAPEIHRYFDTVEADAVAVTDLLGRISAGSSRELAELQDRRRLLRIVFLVAVVAIGIVVLWMRSRLLLDARLAAVEEARQRQEELVARQSQYFATMSHELRTPLVAIRGFALDIGENPAADAASQDAARRIHRDSGELLDLINNILDAAKVQAGHVELRLEDLDLESVLGRCVVRCRRLAGERPVAIELHGATGAPAVRGDFVKLQQVFNNLIGNAVKFTERGRVTVRVQAEDDRVAVAVEDTGIGIPAEQLARIWEPYAQGDEATARRYGGTGLGLSIVRALVALHGGDVKVESIVGQGTTFRVRLPRAPATTTAAPPAGAA